MKSRLNSAKEMPPSAGSVASSRRTACVTHTRHTLNGHHHHHAGYISVDKTQSLLPLPFQSCSCCL